MESDQQIPENKKFHNERPDKQNQISMALIAQTSLQGISASALAQDEKINVILKLKSIHLEWLNIRKIQNLQVFQHLNVLYLQHNRISKIEGLEHLQNLEYLALNDNLISQLENLASLKKLMGLNLNNNQIQEFQSVQLPQNLQLLSFKNNPVCLDIDYKSKILGHLKSLQMLDDLAITPVERFKILGIFPQRLLGYANQMRQFYTKRELKSKTDEQSKPLLFNTQGINQKQALSEIRQKTRKYLYENQQTFQREHASQLENFKEKIEVSKKIRHIKENQEKQRQSRIQEIKKSTMSQLMNNYK